MLAVAGLVKLPLVPVIVNVAVPCVALGAALRVSVEVPEPVTELGEKLALTRLGRPLTLRFTFELKPPDPVIVRVYFTEPLRFTDWLEGETVTVKEPAGLTVRDALAECDMVPLLPTMENE